MNVILTGIQPVNRSGFNGLKKPLSHPAKQGIYLKPSAGKKSKLVADI